MIEQKLLDMFNHHQIPYELHHHEPVFTAEEAHRVSHAVPGAHSKNLFLKDKEGKFVLVSVLDHKRIDLKSLSKLFSKSRYSFASERDLFDYLGVRPGSVTPFGLIHDLNKEVFFLLDKEFTNHTIVNFHPLRNDMTISMGVKPFLDFFKTIFHRPQIIDVPIL